MALQQFVAQQRRRKSVFFALVLLGLFTLLPAGQAWSQRLSLIRDAEIETTIRDMAAPLLRAGGLPVNSVRIHLVRDNRLNAFVAGGLQVLGGAGDDTGAGQGAVEMLL